MSCWDLAIIMWTIRIVGWWSFFKSTLKGWIL